MSSSSFVLAETLSVRARRAQVRGLPSKTKAFVKKCLSRTARKNANSQLANELRSLVESGAARNASPSELDALADYWLDEIGIELRDRLCDEEVAEPERLEPEPDPLPHYLVGALPDWMLSQVEDAKGDAFALLSLFESKSASPKAAFLTEDEVQYA